MPVPKNIQTKTPCATSVSEWICGDLSQGGAAGYRCWVPQPKESLDWASRQCWLCQHPWSVPKAAYTAIARKHRWEKTDYSIWLEVRMSKGFKASGVCQVPAQSIVGMGQSNMDTAPYDYEILGFKLNWSQTDVQFTPPLIPFWRLFFRSIPSFHEYYMHFPSIPTNTIQFQVLTCTSSAQHFSNWSALAFLKGKPIQGLQGRNVTLLGDVRCEHPLV